MPNSIKCIIIDDEPLALDILETYIQSHENLKLVNKFSNAQEASQWLASNENEVDIVFSDIDMPEMSGIDLIKSRYPAPYAIIFTTAHPNYATDAFDFEALDYLLKPIAPDRFAKAIKRAEEYVQLRRNADKDSSLNTDYIFVKVDGQHQKVLYQDIYFVEAFADYVKIWISPDKRIVTLQTMRNMENALPKSSFIRVHRSFIVALDKIESIQNSNISIGGKLIPIGKNYKDAVMEIVKKAKLQ